MFPILQKTVKHLHDSFDCWLMTGYTANQSKNYPFESVSLLQSIHSSMKEIWRKSKEEDKKKILENAMASQNEKAKGIALK